MHVIEKLAVMVAVAAATVAAPALDPSAWGLLPVDADTWLGIGGLGALIATLVSYVGDHLIRVQKAYLLEVEIAVEARRLATEADVERRRVEARIAVERCRLEDELRRLRAELARMADRVDVVTDKCKSFTVSDL